MKGEKKGEEKGEKEEKGDKEVVGDKEVASDKEEKKETKADDKKKVEGEKKVEKINENEANLIITTDGNTGFLHKLMYIYNNGEGIKVKDMEEKER